MKAPLGSSSGKLPLIEFDVVFENETFHIFAPTSGEGFVSASSLQRALAVKLRGKLSPDEKGFFVATNEDGFEREFSGNDNVGDYAAICFELGLTKKQRKEQAAVALTKGEAQSNAQIKEKLQQKRYG